MAHKTLIGGTAYEISGGKTLVNGTAYSIDKGKTLVGSTVYEVGFGGWPDDLDTGLEFVSASPFTLEVAYPKWNGAMEYCNGKGWKAWDGSLLSSGETEDGHCIYIRGVGNTVVVGNSAGKFTLAGTDIECNGNIEKLLDYATVEAGNHPTMAKSCFGSMFYGCTSLKTAPHLPATTLPSSCYANMFQNCTSLVVAPNLPATTLGVSAYNSMFRGCTSLVAIPNLSATTLQNYCYSFMFADCSKIKLSTTATGTYTKAYRIPYSGTGTTASDALKNMFYKTGGTFTGTPSINTTYYLDASNTIV